jgi:hypothetical protein
MTKIKPFENQGDITLFDNAILDNVMPILSPNAWKVLCIIIRQTEGQHLEQNAISYQQLLDSSGIRSFSTIKRAVDELVKLHLVIVIKGRGGNGKSPATNIYKLNRRFAIRSENKS